MREEIKDPGRLEHILSAISKVQEYTAGIEKESLKNDSMRLHATAYNIQIVGEAVYKLTKEFKESHPDTPWRLIENSVPVRRSRSSSMDARKSTALSALICLTSMPVNRMPNLPASMPLTPSQRSITAFHPMPIVLEIL